MLVVMDNFETRHADGVETMHQGSQRTIAFTGKFDRLPIAKQPRTATDGPIAALSLKSLKGPGTRALDIFPPEHCLQFRAADLSAKPVHLVIGDRAEFPLHFLR